MGVSSGVPINEAINILSILEPAKLDELRAEFPEISSELQRGRIGGEEEDGGAFDLDRAEIAARILSTVVNRALEELPKIRKRIAVARRFRLSAQILTLVCSSGVLGSLAMAKSALAILIAVLTLLASIGVLLADYGEVLLKPGKGDVYEAFESTSNASFSAQRLSEAIRLKLRHKIVDAELRSLVADANQLAADLHGWVVKMARS